MERDCIETLFELCHFSISTHTLTWSVTKWEITLLAIEDISTHTLTWSVTCRFFLCRLFLCHFNSHAHVERDSAIALANKSTTISTHTLTWSVTKMLLTWVSRFWISTHTLTWSVTR